MRQADRVALGLAVEESAGVHEVQRQEPAVGQRRASKGPNKTEAEYARIFLAGRDARYEGWTFRLANGHRYTPDWVYVDGGRMACVEVKGSYRFGSHQRARLAWDQARIEWPMISWVWAVRGKDGKWEVES